MSYESATGSAPFDLSAYGVVVDTISAADFFGQEPAAPLTELAGFLTWNKGDNSDGLDALSDRLAVYLDVALYKSSIPGPAGCYYLLELLPAVGFTTSGPGIVTIPRGLALTANNTTTTIQADMTLSYARAPNAVVLVAKEDQTAFGDPNPEPLLVAAAIAVFQDTQTLRTKQELSPLTYVEYPGIIMNGKIPISAALSAAVAAGRAADRHLLQPTRVTKCVVPSQGPDQNMADREYRQRALQYMDAFREFTFDLWERFHGMTNIVPLRT